MSNMASSSLPFIRPQSLQEMAEDITNLVRSCLSSLEQKDANLFGLYEEKMQLETVVESITREKKELTKQLHVSLDTLHHLEAASRELHDRYVQHHGAIHDLDDQLTQLESLCGVTRQSTPESADKSSSSSSTEEIQQMRVSLERCTQFLHALRHDYAIAEVEGDQAALAARLHLQLARDQLLETERLHRQDIVEEGLHGICLHFILREHRAVLEAYQDEKVLNSTQERLREKERMHTEERHQLSMSNLSRELKLHVDEKKRLEDENAQLQHLMEEMQGHMVPWLQESSLWSEYLEGVVRLVFEECEVRESRRSRFRAQCLKYTKASHRKLVEELEVLRVANRELKNASQSAHAGVGLRHERVVATYAKKMEEATTKLETMMKNNDQMREKHRELLESEQQRRQNTEKVIATQKKTIQQLEDRVLEQEKQIAHLSHVESVTRKEKEAAQRRLHTLNETVEKLRPAAARGEAFPPLMQEAEARIANLTAQLTKVKREAEEEVASEREKNRVLVEQLSLYRVSMEKLQEEMHQERRRKEEEHSQAEEEIRKVRLMMASLHEEHESCIRQLEMERHARDVLENQQHLEVNVIKKLMERAEKAEEREADMQHGRVARDLLQKKVMILEEACRKSTEVIAELRETVCTERQLSSQLLSSISSQSKGPLNCSFLCESPSSPLYSTS